MLTDYEKRQRKGYIFHNSCEFAQKIVLEMLKDKETPMSELEILYKDLVKSIFKWNQDLSKELMLCPKEELKNG